MDQNIHMDKEASLEAESLGFGKDFENGQVSFILDKYLESHNNQCNSPKNSMIQRKLNNYSTAQNSQAATPARELMKKGDKFTDYESTLINNLNIASVDEAITLILSLKDKFPNTEILATHSQNYHNTNEMKDNNDATPQTILLLHHMNTPNQNDATPQTILLLHHMMN